MLYRIRTGDIILAENKFDKITNSYLIVNFGGEDGFGLICLSCGDKVGFYGKDKSKFLKDLKGFFNVNYIIPKEYMVDYFNNNYKLDYKVESHDIFEDNEFGVEFELED